ncbi:amiloride-sensitive sodium channel subunit gamma-like [Athalia rosae]|uniref:amiloride-sensitive sodium channel subunit gamma-like n=1 Tax=Athalia rosae TaxID=37344 RepID=UPI0020347112|nr:amiloride-sensitive sodium channel subunit gamma-like [Athalia rosae]
MKQLEVNKNRRSQWLSQKICNLWRPVWLTWHKYLGLTTIPGLQSVHNAQGKFFTLVWSILFTIGLACTIRDVYVNCLDYLAYPVTTAMNLKQATALPFPAVTVCNLNRVHCGNLKRLVRQNRGTDLGERLERMYEVTNCAHVRRAPRSSIWYGDHQKIDDNLKTRIAGSRVSRGIPTQLPSVPPPTSTITNGADEEEDGKPPINQTQSFNDLMNFMALYANFSEDDRAAMGHDAAGFIRACTFSGKSCSNVTLFFKIIPSTSYGNCFTFATARRTVMPGRDYGLSMELYLDQLNYIGGGLSPRAGARVVVHPRSQLPLPNENGLTIPPHTATSAALVQVEVTREELPYVTNCTSGWDRTWYKERVGGAYKYSMERCQRICLQLAFEDFCSCTHPSYMDLSTGASPCNLTSDNQDYACVGRVLDEFETRIKECSCNMDCSETTYDMKISQAAWPNDNNWCDVAQRFGMAKACKYEGYQSDHRTREKQLVLQNVLTIDVFFENLRVQSINQQPTYKLQSFVGSLGGALSLYLGVTLFMLLEVLEVLVRLVFALFYRGCSIILRRKPLTEVRNWSNGNHGKRKRVVAQHDFIYNQRGQSRNKEKVNRPIKFVW